MSKIEKLQQMRIGKRNGSALIWTLMAILVLSIVLTFGLMGASSFFSATNAQHANKQAYLTALSITKAYAEWMQDTDAPNPQSMTGRSTFMESLETETMHLDFTEAELGNNMGGCDVDIRYLDEDHRSIQIVTTAVYQGQEATVVATMTGTGSVPPSHLFPVSDFSVADYAEEAERLNGLTFGDPVNVFGKKGTDDGVYFSTGYTNASAKRDYNDENQTYVDSLIDASSNREVTWFETSGTGTTNAFSGTRDMPYIGETIFENQTAPFAKARVVTPKNGRFAFNPVNKPPSDATYSSDDTAAKNTKYAGFNIDDTAGKDVLVRLANADKLGQRTKEMPRNAIIAIDFTDNRYSDETDERGNYNSDTGSKLAGSGTNEMRYWPNKWNSARIYTRNVAGDKINANLLFGPYMRVHTGENLDYRGWAHYRNNHKGGKNEYWEYCSKMLDSGSLNGTYYEDVEDNTGMPLMSVEWGDNMGVYILDDTDKYVRFLQGVNLMNSVIYSMRDTIIGGGIVWESSGDYFDNIYNNAYGFLDSPYNFTLYPLFTCTQNQVISDTDIVLLAPEGKTRKSTIRHPDSWKNFEGRKLTITGGDIYVGARQTLTIESEVKDDLAVTGLVKPEGDAMVGNWYNDATTRKYCNYTEKGNTMNIAPDRIIVDTGGTLTIMGNQNNRTNVNTDIYVKGTLNLRDGVKIHGNIYVYGGGHLNVDGSYVIASSDGEQGGIFIYGDETFGTDGTSAGAGTVKLPVNGVQKNTSGKIHLLNPNLAGQIDTGFLCDDRDPQTGLCRAFHGPDTGRPTEWTVQYSGS
jgi:hypothetical protein